MRQLRLSAALMILTVAAASAQTQFEGFEEWETRHGRQQPVGWSLGSGSGPASEAYSGKDALSVWTWYCSSLGGAILGDVGERAGYICDDFAFGCYGDYGVPISFKPVALTGYYRYVPGAADPGADASAQVRVLLKKYNQSRGTYDTIGVAEHSLLPAEAYTQFTVPIEDRAPGVTPDSIAVVFISSGLCDCEVEGDCYYLSVDDLAFTATSGVPAPDGEREGGTLVYPNPSSGTARMEWGKILDRPHRLRVHAITGELVRVIDGVTGSSVGFETAGLSPGEYLFDLIGDGGNVAVRGRFLVDR